MNKYPIFSGETGRKAALPDLAEEDDHRTILQPGEANLLLLSHWSAGHYLGKIRGDRPTQALGALLVLRLSADSQLPLRSRLG